MFELPKNHYSRVLSLFEPDQPNSTIIFSTLEGRTPGKAYINNVDTPTACLLVIPYYNYAYLGGVSDQQWLNQTVAELRQGQGLNLVWSPQLSAQWALPATPDVETVCLEFDALASSPAPSIPEGHSLRTIDEELFTRCLWREDMLMAFGTTENFLKYGIGTCLMADEEICSEAYAIFLGAGKFEIVPVTHEKYRQRGYAYVTCQHLIQLFEARGYPTYWSCYGENVASVATARKLGFRNPRAYKLLEYTQID